MGLTAPGRKLLGAGPAHSVPGCARRVLGRPPQADSRPGPRSAEGHFSACGPWWAGQLELGRPWPWMRLPARGQQGSGCQVLGARAQCLGSRLEKPSFPGSPRCRQRPRPAPRGHGGRGDSTVAAGRPQWSGRHVYVTFPAAPCPLAGVRLSPQRVLMAPALGAPPLSPECFLAALRRPGRLQPGPLWAWPLGAAPGAALPFPAMVWVPRRGRGGESQTALSRSALCPREHRTPQLWRPGPRPAGTWVSAGNRYILTPAPAGLFAPTAPAAPTAPTAPSWFLA